MINIYNVAKGAYICEAQFPLYNAQSRKKVSELLRNYKPQQIVFQKELTSSKDNLKDWRMVYRL